LIFLCSLCLPPSSTLLPYTTLFRSLIGGNPHDGGLPVDQSFLLHLDREADGGKPRALAVAGLKHKELSILDGELEILDVSEMVLELCANLLEFCVGFRKMVLQFGDVFRRADAGDNIFALRIDHQFAVENSFTGRQILV